MPETSEINSAINCAFSEVVTEIRYGLVEIVRTAYYNRRCKVGVRALMPGINPVSVCVGRDGCLVNDVKYRLNLNNNTVTDGVERIDVFEWDDDPRRLIDNALGRQVDLLEAKILPDQRRAEIVVSDSQMGYALGSELVNIMLTILVTEYFIEVPGASVEDVHIPSRSSTRPSRGKGAGFMISGGLPSLGKHR